MSIGFGPYIPQQGPGQLGGGPANQPMFGNKLSGSIAQPVFGMPPGYTQRPGQPAGGPVAPSNQQYQPYFQQMHQGMDNLQQGLKQVEQMVMPGQQGQSQGPSGGKGDKGMMFGGVAQTADLRSPYF